MKDGEALRQASDEELARAAAAAPASDARRAAAAELFRRHRGTVYLWCRRYCRDHERALDLAQDVMMNAWKAIASFEGRSRFTSWLFVIARNRCLRAVAAPALLADEDVAPDDLPVPDADPARLYQQRQDEEALLGIMERELAPREREALWLRCFERMPVEAITEVLKLESASGARGVLQSARRKLRAALERAPDRPAGTGRA